jgi:hypothetical protein
MKNKPLPASLLACLLIHLLPARPASAQIVFTRVTNSPVATSVSGTAAAWGDYNNDGWVDLYVTTLSGPAYLFRNNGNGTFTSVTGVPMVAGNMNSFACVWGDYDNDGFLDLLQGGYSLPSRLFRNNGNGSFTQITSGPMASIDRGANNVLWGDYDNDGWLDVFIAISFNSPKNVLYRNNAGSFTQMTNSPPVNMPGNSEGGAWGDFDNDGWLDLVVGHTGSHCQLFRNTHAGFAELTNSAVNLTPSEVFGGTSWGDYDNDGWLDLFVSSYGGHCALFHNDGQGGFTRMTSGPIYERVAKSTGGAWADYDNDGWLDLFVANDSGANSSLYHNNGDGTFTAVTNGAIVNTPGTSQGACWGDFDNDGFPDLLVPNRSTFNNYLYHNEGSSNAWVSFKLEGRVSNRAAIGAKVRLRAIIGGRTVWQLREVSGGGSLGSQNDLRAAFGLGDATNADLVRVEWPSGIRQEFQNVAPRQFLSLVEPEARITPAVAEVPAGGGVAFAVDATWPSPAAFQWRLNGADLPGETNATLVIAHATTGAAGIYTVTVSDPATGSSYNSFPAKLTGPVWIEQPPSVLNLRPGSNGMFSVTVSGSSPITYHWRFNGVPLPDETNATLTIANATDERVGSYDVVVANSYGPVVSPPASLGLLINLVVTAQPVTQTVPLGGSATLSVAVSGSPAPFSFEWHRGSVSIWTNVTSARASFLSLSNVQAGQAGPYRVVIKNAATPPTGLVSSAAILSVGVDTDGDGLPDDWETNHQFSATDAADATQDADGDGATNLQEFLAGTDPWDASSLLRIEAIAQNRDGVVTLQFTAQSNKTYTVRASPATDGAAWVRVADVPAAPTNRTVVVTDPSAPIAAGQRFYRLASPRLP